MRRWLLFFFAILAGVGLGLLYGWVINPIEYTNTSLHQLHNEYQTDYVLMVAETYQLEGNLVSAARRLSELSPTSPADVVRHAVVNATRLGYAEGDLVAMHVLLSTLDAILPTSEATAP